MLMLVDVDSRCQRGPLHTYTEQILANTYAQIIAIHSRFPAHHYWLQWQGTGVDIDC
jgi:hypothetical protein